jgi:hypothetical protein
VGENLREVSKLCSTSKERGQGTGRNRKRGITSGRVEILERRSIWPSSKASRIERMKLFGASAASGRRREGKKEDKNR